MMMLERDGSLVRDDSASGRLRVPRQNSASLALRAGTLIAYVLDAVSGQLRPDAPERQASGIEEQAMPTY